MAERGEAYSPRALIHLAASVVGIAGFAITYLGTKSLVVALGVVGIAFAVLAFLFGIALLFLAATATYQSPMLDRMGTLLWSKDRGRGRLEAAVFGAIFLVSSVWFLLGLAHGSVD